MSFFPCLTDAVTGISRRISSAAELNKLLCFTTKASHSILLNVLWVSAYQAGWELKAHLADKVDLFLCGAEWAKPQVIMGIMEHAAVWVHVPLSCYTITHRQVVWLKEKKKKWRSVVWSMPSVFVWNAHAHTDCQSPQSAIKVYVICLGICQRGWLKYH